MKTMTLAQFIPTNSAQIIAEWEQFARTYVSAARKMDFEGRRDHVQGMLEKSQRTLRSRKPRRSRRVSRRERTMAKRAVLRQRTPTGPIARRPDSHRWTWCRSFARLRIVDLARVIARSERGVAPPAKRRHGPCCAAIARADLREPLQRDLRADPVRSFDHLTKLGRDRGAPTAEHRLPRRAQRLDRAQLLGAAACDEITREDVVEGFGVDERSARHEDHDRDRCPHRADYYSERATDHDRADRSSRRAPWS